MLQSSPYYLFRLQVPLLNQWICHSCQIKAQRTWLCRQVSTTPPKHSKVSTDDDHNLKTLSHPLGQPHPPQLGENSGIDPRPWTQRRDDFLNYDKHLKRREELKSTISKPYFREWTNMQYHAGKTFLSPPSLIRREKALYFPNIRGYTLANPHKIGDTTSVLLGKVSIVSLFSGKWAADQTRTFLEDKEFERQWGLIAGREAQRVDINVEEDWMKAWIVRMSLGGLKRLRPEEEWGRYFVVRRGFSAEVKESLGIANGKVGYVYLVDEDCKVRWAACGEAAEGENDGLARGVGKLIEGRGANGKEGWHMDLGRTANRKKLNPRAKGGVVVGTTG